MIHQITSRHVEKVAVRCDSCGRDCEESRQHDATEFSLGLARASAKFAGWQEKYERLPSKKVLRRDICPACAGNVQPEATND